MVSHTEVSTEDKFISGFNSIHKTKYWFGITKMTVFKQMLYFIPVLFYNLHPMIITCIDRITNYP